MTDHSASTTGVFEWVIVDDVAVSFARPGDVPDAVWTRYLGDLRANRIQCILGCSTGITSLSATQRRAAAETLKELGIFAAVITDSALTRGLVTAVSWLGANTKSYSWKDLDKVLQEIGRSTETTARIREVVDKYRVNL